MVESWLFASLYILFVVGLIYLGPWLFGVLQKGALEEGQIRDECV